MWHDRTESAHIPPSCADWNAAHDARGPGCREGREPGVHEGAGRSRLQRDSGASILGTGGDEVIHCVLDMMYARAPYTVMQSAMHIHPTVSELIPTMLGELQPI